MSEQNENVAEVQVHEGGTKEIPFLSPEITLVIFTWITFITLFVILKKFAWTPILKALDEREATIRKAIEDADKAKEELAKINATREQILNEAHVKSRQILDEARKGAIDAAHVIQQKAKDESKIILENALREIKEVKEKAQADLRAESAKIAVTLAGKLISENLDDDKNRKLVGQYLKEI